MFQGEARKYVHALILWGLSSIGWHVVTLKLDSDGSLVLARDLPLFRIGIGWMVLEYISGLSMATPCGVVRAGLLMGHGRYLSRLEVVWQVFRDYGNLSVRGFRRQRMPFNSPE